MKVEREACEPKEEENEEHTHNNAARVKERKSETKILEEISLCKM